MARFEAFLSNPRVESVSITSTTADRFSRLAKMLRDKGRRIPSNDLWIAAQVVETGADLLSADVHFAEVDGLAWIPFSLNEEDTVRERVRRYYAEVP
ncbi:MAG: PIN domain-containing protein, partial [Acidobacteriota bacterium]|nr:PIN domain-containing protein [Acidobacteriota bacterium]